MTATAYGWSIADTREMLRDTLRLDTDPPAWECPCGCGGGVAYHRDARALWVLSTTSATPRPRILGLETRAELDDFLDRADYFGILSNTPARDLATLRVVLEEAWARVDATDPPVA